MKDKRNTERYMTVPGAKLLSSERTFLRDKAAEICGSVQHCCIVNIGVMWGASMHCLRAGAPGAELIGIDIDYKTKPVYYPRLLVASMLIVGDSREIWRTCGIDNIQLLFIDGSHLVEDVKRDIAGWVPKVVVGGMVIFHDYNVASEDLKRDPTLIGVQQAVRAMMREPLAFLPTGMRLEPVAVDAPGSIIAFRRIK